MKRWPTALLAVLFVVACGKGPEHAADSLRLAIDVSPASLDPRLGSDESSRRVQQLLFNGLIRFDGRGEPQGDLAASWEQTDALRYVFHLRPGIRFHNGRPLTSDDVRYTVESILQDEVLSFLKGDLAVIDGMETPDAATIVFRLKEPFAPFLVNLGLGILPRGSGADVGLHPVGTGPYRLKEFRRDQGLVLQAFDGYFRGRPPCPTIRLKVVPEVVSRQQELLKGSVDLVVNDLTPDQVEALRGSKDLEILSGPSNSTTYLGFNLEDPILKDVRVRQAIAYALDRRQIIQVLLHGLAREATGLLPPDHWAYEPNVRTYAQDEAKAASLLDAAGYLDPDGAGPRSRFQLTYKTTTAELAREQASVFQEQLKRVGIDLEIRSYEWGTFYDDIKAGRFQIFSLQWTQLLDPDVFRLRFGSGYLPPAGSNRVRYRNPEVDRLLIEGTRARTVEERRRAYSRIQSILAEELPYFNLWHKSNVAVLRRRVQGFTLTPSADFYVLEQVSLR
ncbi:MAG: ABC transporter substrate-binding protein [Acidobacteria bacterium]|nr:MAG: ABC transporter substrate-binding protein [Acidobacteriota bacterium]